MERTQSIVTFYRMIDSADLPKRADRSALGTLPTRAFRYCDSVTTASGFGWYVSTPIDLWILWDGQQIWWRCEGLEDWLPLSAAQYPYFAKRFAATAPDCVREYPPPFLTALREPGLIQIWTGLAAKTAPGWSLLIRPLSNLPQISGLEAYEGIIETDKWFGPIFTNFRITCTNVPIALSAGEPLLQIQPIPQFAYSSTVLGSSKMITSLDDFTPEDWACYENSLVAPLREPTRRRGRYATQARKARVNGCPVADSNIVEDEPGE